MPEPTPFGHFEGDVIAVWLADGRNMRLTADFAYVDPRRKRWLSPKDSVVNGASIPWIFWSVIGGPFEGQYRNASVLHDVACEQMHNAWQNVHLMFYEACRCGGVAESRAKLMYWAVYHFGPRWRLVSETRVVDNRVESVITMARETPRAPASETVNRAVQYFDANNPSLEQIETLTFAEEN